MKQQRISKHGVDVQISQWNRSWTNSQSLPLLPAILHQELNILGLEFEKNTPEVCSLRFPGGAPCIRHVLRELWMLHGLWVYLGHRELRPGWYLIVRDLPLSKVRSLTGDDLM